MRLNNSGHNCIAGQVVIVSRDWDQREAFLAALRTAYATAPQRPIWYPGSEQRLTTAAEDHPGAMWLAGGTRALAHIVPRENARSSPESAAAVPLEQTEYFAPVLGVVELAGTGLEFLEAAIGHANERLAGTLGANVLVDPETERRLGAGFEHAIAALRYGGIAINAWTGVVFATPVLPWGAFPGGTLADVGSGIGVVHNTLLLDGVERAVMRGPFRPFPRSWLRRGVRSLLPKPPWFVDSRTGSAVAEGLTRWHMHHRVPALLATLAAALRS
jgi:acyl-CoA reductase-like NAD-dependent aldehyde dehydrogenase